MFGYVLPVKGEMKVRDFEAYRSVYCGVCKQLGKSFGVFSRFLLNYDLVLVGVLADGLSGEAGQVRCEGCFANPLAKRCTMHATGGLSLAADGLVMLSWHKLRDNLDDEKPPKKWLYGISAPAVKGMYRKAAERHPEIAECLQAQMDRQAALEAAGCQSLDEAADPTAQMCAAIFEAAGQTENQRRILARMGLFCGQIVYLLDAAEDYADDAKAGKYNVFIKAGLNREAATEAAKRRCRMAAGEIALCYNLLDFKQHKDILDNIFFLGLPQGIARAGIKRSKSKGAGHGQIESV
ncbi:DUF5685 family protein [Ruminococcaceae bacterium OttesenSCG-928-A11]|nr:DUF5685 family protein [Ruminococcaceae bacterium OttesenSCG-928-A11]